jgi:predicted  nucleic acid-binding Zn-ribbon protein
LNATLVVTIIVASLSFLGTIILGLIQTRNSKSQAKKTDIEAYTILVDSITKRTDTEFNIMKGINATLKEQVETLQREKIELENEIKDLEERLNKCEQCLKENKDA